MVGDKNPMSKIYIIIFPDEHKEVIKGIAEFCRNNNIDGSSMVKVAKGLLKQYKGFKCRYATEQEIVDYNKNN